MKKEAVKTVATIIGNKLRIIRERKKLSLAKAARLLGWNPSNLQRVEQGRHDILVPTLLKILEAYNIPLDKFSKMRG